MTSQTARPFHSDVNPTLRSKFAEDIFNSKYAHEGCETWERLCHQLVDDVCHGLLPEDECHEIKAAMTATKFIPGGRYLYYAGRPTKFYNNCFLLKAETDTREDWANLSWKAESCLMIGGGIGVDYSVYRCKGSPLGRTGGVASGPIPKMQMINEIGRHVKQGGSRRSAIYASLNWQHADAQELLTIKNWPDLVANAKKADFNFPAALDNTNISLNYDTAWLSEYWRTGEVGETFTANVKQALSTGEPGFSFNFFDKENETLRNACTEITSEDDSDVCNLGSVNLAVIDNLQEFMRVVELATKFLVCGTLRAHLPYEKVSKVREKNRRLGLGLMGIHEWLLQRGYTYRMNLELRKWLHAWRAISDNVADRACDLLSISRCKGKRAIAPTGSIAIIGSTTSGIEPVYAVAFKRRYLKGERWHWRYQVDSVSLSLIQQGGIDPEKVESASDLAADPERRIAFQADVQDYCDHAISSTINLPSWGSVGNNETHVWEFSRILAKYAHRIRGFTCYPDGARGGQPLVPVAYDEAISRLGHEFTEEDAEVNDVCDITGKGGSCGI